MRRLGLAHFYGSILLLVVLDRLFKSFALASEAQHVIVIPGWFEFAYTLNTKAALSIPIPMVLYSFVFGFVVAFAVLAWMKAGGMTVRLLRAAGVLILVGAVSNLFDRIRYGGVIDMLHVPSLGACNLADVYIIVGVGLWLVHEYTSKPRLDPKQKTA